MRLAVLIAAGLVLAGCGDADVKKTALAECLSMMKEVTGDVAVDKKDVQGSFVKGCMSSHGFDVTLEADKLCSDIAQLVGNAACYRPRGA